MVEARRMDENVERIRPEDLGKTLGDLNNLQEKSDFRDKE